MFKVVANFLLIPVLVSFQALGNSTIHRCSVDNLNPEQARGRNRYVNACSPQTIVAAAQLFRRNTFAGTQADAWRVVSEVLEKDGGIMPKPRPHHFTPIIEGAPEAPVTWAAPTVGPSEVQFADAAFIADFCARSENAIPAGNVFNASYRCMSSCFAPEVRVFFKEGYVAIKDAVDANVIRQVVVLDKGSTISSPKYVLAGITNWVKSIRSEKQDYLTFRTEDGGNLKVTPNHPMIDGEGMLKEASKLKLGDSLVRANGQRIHITEIEPSKEFGKVYNLQTENKTAKGNIIVAEGFLTGSAYLQDSGSVYLDQQILRAELPDSILAR